MEGARHLQRHHLLRAEFLGHCAGGGHALGRPGDDHLPGGVEVGHPHIAVGAAACHLDLVVVETEHRGHRAGVLAAGVVHGLGAFAHQPHTLVESQHSGGGEGGVFTQAVTGAEARLDAQTFDRVEHHQARHERGELGVAGVAQFVGIGVEQQIGDVALGDL